MKHLIDLNTGTLVLMPETQADSILIYRLINSPDLSNFSQYVALENSVQSVNMTTDLGVPVENIVAYPILPDPINHQHYYDRDTLINRAEELASLPNKVNANTEDHDGEAPDEEWRRLAEMTIFDFKGVDFYIMRFCRGTGQRLK